MNIELSELAALLRGTPTPAPKSGRETPVNLGMRIVVLDRGFVYVGNVEEFPSRIVIRDASNIRIWGTTKGLGELVTGPTPNTKVDRVGVVEVYRHAVIVQIPCTGF